LARAEFRGVGFSYVTIVVAILKRNESAAADSTADTTLALKRSEGIADRATRYIQTLDQTTLGRKLRSFRELLLLDCVQYETPDLSGIEVFDHLFLPASVNRARTGAVF
jgi:hypothetical protein